MSAFLKLDRLHRVELGHWAHVLATTSKNFPLKFCGISCGPEHQRHGTSPGAGGTM